MVESADRLCKAIGYPTDELSSAAGRVVLKVDGAEVLVTEDSGRLVLSLSLGSPEEDAFRRLAGFAAGRLLKEEAALAWDPRTEELILWQTVSAGAGPEALKRFFEVFMASCDWWRGRVFEEGSGERVPELMIRP